MRPMSVIVPDELGQDLTEMPLAEDQHLIQALTAKRSHEPLGKCVAPHRQLHLIRVIGTDASGSGSPRHDTQVHQEITDLLHGPGPSGFAVTPGMYA